MTIDAETRDEPTSTLQGMEVHESWARRFRTPENDRFFGMAFDHVAQCFGPPGNDAVLDAGCGSGTKSLLLARRGYRVLSLDFSAAILESARLNAAAAGLSGQMQFMRGDLTNLELSSASVRRILCWGVLMHVPDVAKAIAELARVLAPGGTLILSEGNVRSVQAVSLRLLKRLLGRERAEIKRTPAGIEFWESTGSGMLMTRQADIAWLISEFRSHGVKLVRRRAGQFTETYTLLASRPLRRLVHSLNHIWFRRVRLAGPAFGNILVFVKA